MSLGRLPLGAVVALLVGAGCYDVPTPDCGFACGPAAACPADYTCSAIDNRCHRVGAAPDLVCPAATPVDPRVAPSVAFATPSDGEVDIAVTVRPQFQFSEPVTGVSESSIQMFEDVTSAPVSIRVDYDGELNAAQLNPLTALAQDTRYRIVLGAAITDFEGNPLLDAPLTLRFTTAIDVPPQVTFVSPDSGATGVPVTANLYVAFSETIQGLETAVTLRDAGGALVAGTHIIDPGAFGVAFYPSAALDPGVVYTATLSPALTDTAGSPLVGAPISWSFTTFEDVLPPSFAASAPVWGDTDVATSTDIRISFDEAVTNADATSVLVSAGGTPIPGTVTTAFSGLQIVFTPDAALPAGATIDVTVTTAVTDLAGNPLAAPVTLSFTTAP